MSIGVCLVPVMVLGLGFPEKRDHSLLIEIQEVGLASRARRFMCLLIFPGKRVDKRDMKLINNYILNSIININNFDDARGNF
jgi:hypothetical protein